MVTIKNHTTVKFLMACNPNGVICFTSPAFVGFVSVDELTKLSDFLEKLEDKSGMSIMADRGLLSRLDIEFNVPPFLNEHKQLPATKLNVHRKKICFPLYSY